MLNVLALRQNYLTFVQHENRSHENKTTCTKNSNNFAYTVLIY